MAQTLRTIKDLLMQYGLQPKYKFGQNFLHDQAHIQKIIQAIAIDHKTQILEIGPGTGALSESLLEAGAHVLAAEIDTDLEPLLRERMAPFGERFQLLMGDALEGKHTINQQVCDTLGDKPFTLAANLPYNAASPIILNLALRHHNCEAMIIMVQKEVADRIVAPHNSKTYGALSILAQAMCTAEKVSTLPPGCFYPPPKVHSAVVKLTRRDTPLCHDPDVFSTFVQGLFQKRRKQLGSILGRDKLPEWLNPTLRPEALSVEELCRLCADMQLVK